MGFGDQGFGLRLGFFIGYSVTEMLRARVLRSRGRGVRKVEDRSQELSLMWEVDDAEQV